MTRSPSSSRPLVTVCMPAYNYGHFIEQAVRSAWAETYRPLELVVVDDGSTDGTWELLKRLEPESPIPMTVLKGQHRGVAAALNLALTAAKGEWISVLHADDYSHPDRIAAQVARVDSPDVVAVHSEYVCVDERGRETGYDSSTDLPPAVGQDLRAILLRRADVRSMTMLIRRSALDAIGRYQEDLPVEDWQSILRLAKAGEFRHVPQRHIFRRVHGANISIGAQKKKTFSFKEIAIDVLKEVAPPDLDWDHLCVLHASVVIKNALAQGGFAKAVDGFNQCWKRYPSQRVLLTREFASGLRSWLWLSHVRDRLPEGATRALLKLKALGVASRARARRG